MEWRQWRKRYHSRQLSLIREDHGTLPPVGIRLATSPALGYARVSTVDQNLSLQRDALTAAGCERVFTDEGVSGRVTARRGLDGALAALSSATPSLFGNRIGLGYPSLTSLRS